MAGRSRWNCAAQRCRRCAFPPARVAGSSCRISHRRWYLASRLPELQQEDPRVVVVELSRNWGHQAALTAGLSEAKGDAVVFLDGDLQDPPRVILDLVAAWRKGAEVVIAERRSRRESGLRRLLFP